MAHIHLVLVLKDTQKEEFLELNHGLFKAGRTRSLNPYATQEVATSSAILK